MKKIQSYFIVIFTLFTLTLSAQTKSVTLEWDPSPDTNVVGYVMYYKDVLAPSFFSTNIPGKFSTNVVIGGLMVNVVYQFQVTAYISDGLESDFSNQIRYQYFYVNANKATPLVLGDSGTTNFANFLLISSPTNGIITGTPPNVTFSPTVGFTGKDSFSYKSPELFNEINITNGYGIYKVDINVPPNIKSVTPL